MDRRIFMLLIVLVLLLIPFTGAGANPLDGAENEDSPWEGPPGGGTYHDYYDDPRYSMEIVRGRVLEVEDTEGVLGQDYFTLRQVARVEILSGKLKGQVFTVYNELFGHPLFDITMEQGQVMYFMTEFLEEEILAIHLSDYVRDKFAYWLVGLFVLLMLLIGRSKGLKAIFSLALLAVMIWFYFIPLLHRGYEPIFLAITLAAFVTLVTLLVIGGYNRKSAAAILGTVGGVLIAGFLAYLVGGMARLTGFSSQEAQMLEFAETGVRNIRGILFAGIIIGSLGAVMDVTMSVASACSEMTRLDSRISRSRLIRGGMNVGRDIMGTMSNTLILAYTGTTIPLLLLFYIYETPVNRIMNMDMIATEVVRAFSGTIGLIVAIPLTAVLAGFLMVGDTGSRAEAGEAGQTGKGSASPPAP